MRANQLPTVGMQSNQVLDASGTGLHPDMCHCQALQNKTWQDKFRRETNVTHGDHCRLWGKAQPTNKVPLSLAVKAFLLATSELLLCWGWEQHSAALF